MTPWNPVKSFIVPGLCLYLNPTGITVQVPLHTSHWWKSDEPRLSCAGTTQLPRVGKPVLVNVNHPWNKATSIFFQCSKGCMSGENIHNASFAVKGSKHVRATKTASWTIVSLCCYSFWTGFVLPNASSKKGTIFSAPLLFPWSTHGVCSVNKSSKTIKWQNKTRLLPTAFERSANHHHLLDHPRLRLSHPWRQRIITFSPPIPLWKELSDTQVLGYNDFGLQRWNANSSIYIKWYKN